MSATITGRPGNGAPPRPGGRSGFRLRVSRNPLRLLFSAALWTSAGYLVGYLIISGALFGVALAAATTAAVLCITLAGIPLLAAAAGVVRGCANVERGRLRPMFAEPVTGRYRLVDRPGIVAQATVRWRDRATWRDMAYLTGLFVPLLALDTIVVAFWATFLAGMTVPAWYWTVRGAVNVGYVGGGPRGRGLPIGIFPHGVYGPGAVGLLVNTLPKALLVAGCALVLFLLFNYVLVSTARTHARIARALLRPPADPLSEARGVLAGPGPLGPLTGPPTNGKLSAGHPA